MDRRSSRVLVVDDNGELRETLRIVLETAGYEVACAGNGSEALTAIDGTPPDLILVDIQMPVMNAAELLRELRLRGEINPFGIIAMSGQVGASASPAKWFLKKPLDMDLTLAIVAEFCGQSDVSRPWVRKQSETAAQTWDAILEADRA